MLTTAKTIFLPSLSPASMTLGGGEGGGGSGKNRSTWKRERLKFLHATTSVLSLSLSDSFPHLSEGKKKRKENERHGSETSSWWWRWSKWWRQVVQAWTLTIMDKMACMMGNGRHSTCSHSLSLSLSFSLFFECLLTGGEWREKLTS